MNDEFNAIVASTEKAIQALLLDLEEKLTPFRIDYVEVDTRKFANLRTEIFTKKAGK